MDTILALTFLIAVLGFGLGILNPKWVGFGKVAKPRRKLMLVFGSLALVSISTIDLSHEETSLLESDGDVPKFAEQIETGDIFGSDAVTITTNSTVVDRQLPIETSTLLVPEADISPEEVAPESKQTVVESIDPEARELLDIVLGLKQGTRWVAARDLRNIGEKASFAVPELLDLLLDPDAPSLVFDSVSETVEVLTNSSHRDQIPKMLGVIQRYAESRDEVENHIRQRMLRAMGKTGADLGSFVPDLVALLEEASASLYLDYTKIAALETIRTGHHGIDKTELFPVLIDLATPGHIQHDLLRREAFITLYVLGPDDSMKPTLMALLDRDETNSSFWRTHGSMILDSFLFFAPEIVSDLLPYVLSKDAETANHAMRVLQHMGKDASKAVSELIGIFNGTSQSGGSPDVAADALESIGPRKEIIEAFLEKHLESPTLGIGHRLVRLGPDVVRHLADGFAKYQEPEAHQEITKLLIEFGSDAKPATSKLLAALKRTDDRHFMTLGVRYFYNVDPTTPQAAPWLVEQIKYPSATWYEGLLELIIGLGPHSVPHLRTILVDNESYQHQMVAAELLGLIGKPAEGVIPDLVKILNDEEEFVLLRVAVMVSLGNFGPKAKAAINTTAKFITAGYRAEALNTLVAIGSDSLDALENVVTATERRFLKREPKYESRIRADVTKAIGLIGIESGSRKATRMLEKLRDDDDFDVRSEARRALEIIGG